MRNIYIFEQNSKIQKNGEYLTVAGAEGKISDISLLDVEAILLFGNVQITTQATTMILEKGIDILFLTLSGQLKGRLVSEVGRNIAVRVAQYGVYFNNELRMQIAKSIVKEKMKNQQEVIKNYRYRRKQLNLEKQEKLIEMVQKKLEFVNSLDEIRGLEGSAAAAYFSVFSEFLCGQEFEKRECHPAYDMVNSLLNLTYAFLKNEITSVLLGYSLDIQLGFLHDVRSGRDSLSYDLMEEYRPILADRFVIQLLNKRMFSEEDFDRTEQGMRLKKESLKKYCQYFQEYMYETDSEGKTWKQRIEEQLLKFRHELQNQYREMEAA